MITYQPGDDANEIHTAREARDTMPVNLTAGTCLYLFPTGERCAREHGHTGFRGGEQHVAITHDSRTGFIVRRATPPVLRGLVVSVLRSADGRDFSNGGVSSHAYRVTLVGELVEEYGGALFAPTEDAPAVRIVQRAGTYGIARPVEVPDGGVGPMASGAYIASTDSRFCAISRHVGCGGSAIPLHDRVETPAQYAALTSD